MRDGKKGLAVSGRIGRPSFLSVAQRDRLEAMLLKGAIAFGFRTDLWTLGRVADLIRRKFGVRYTEAGKHLRRHVRGRVLIIWDGLAAHRSRTTRDYTESQRTWLSVERLPSYAPEPTPSKRYGLGSSTGASRTWVIGHSPNLPCGHERESAPVESASLSSGPFSQRQGYPFEQNYDLLS